MIGQKRSRKSVEKLKEQFRKLKDLPPRRMFTATEQTVLKELEKDKTPQGRKKYKAFRKELEKKVYDES